MPKPRKTDTLELFRGRFLHGVDQSWINSLVSFGFSQLSVKGCGESARQATHNDASAAPASIAARTAHAGVRRACPSRFDSTEPDRIHFGHPSAIDKAR